MVPDLSGLDYPLKRYLILLVLTGYRGLPRKQRLYIQNFVRLVDKAIREYQSARSTIIAQLDEAKRPPEEMAQDGRFLHILDFTDYFENCINAVSRLLKQLDRIKSESEGWRIPRLVRRSIEAHSGTIVEIRNVAEHMAETIQEDSLREGQPVMFTFGGKGDTAVLAAYEIRFEDLALIIRKLHDIALNLLYVGPSGHAT
jgi:hypothetical protein